MSNLRVSPAAGIVLVLSTMLFIGLFADVLVADHNFFHRDTAHFYYPYFKMIAQEWSEGRIPLWNPWENGGMPLAANPTASVFYPLKLLFVLPYALGFKLYILSHIVLCGATCYFAARRFGTSGWGAGLAAMSFAGSGFVLAQLNNVVYLSGAAWLPIGIWAVDRIVRVASLRAAVCLAVVLALQTLGGDPQTAYITGVFGFFYFLVYSATKERRGVPRRLLLLVGAAVFALALAAVQVLPTLELLQVAQRDALDSAETVFRFSYFPANLLSLAFPSIFGGAYPVQTRWAPFANLEPETWISSLYLGLLPLCCAIAASRFLSGPAHRRFLSWTAVASTLLAFGKFGGLAWLANPELLSGGLYGLAFKVLPGFDLWRYPSKLLLWSTLSTALLAGHGFDHLVRAQSRRWIAVSALWAALCLIATLTLGWGWNAWGLAGEPHPIAGPFDPTAALVELRRTILHSGLVAAAIAGVLWYRQRAMPSLLTPCLAAMLGLTALDLGVANRQLVLTDRQDALDEQPRLIAAIEAEEARSGNTEPFRIFRPMDYVPFSWERSAGEDRRAAYFRWERATLRPKFGEPQGMAHIFVPGTIDIAPVRLMFDPWLRSVPPALQQRLPDQPSQMYYYPRTAYDAWNVKYFVLPYRQAFTSASRSTFTLLGDRNGQLLNPLSHSTDEQDDYLLLKNPDAFPRAWVVHRVERRDPLDPRDVEGLKQRTWELVYRERDWGIAFWPNATQPVFPLREAAMVEVTGEAAFASSMDGGAADPNESVTIDTYDPNRIVLQANLDRPGMVVIAETFYPGWRATVNGEPTKVFRTNRTMRGVLVPEGQHRLVMTYHCRPFVVGAAISAFAWLGFVFGAGRRMRTLRH